MLHFLFDDKLFSYIIKFNTSLSHSVWESQMNISLFLPSLRRRNITPTHPNLCCLFLVLYYETLEFLSVCALSLGTKRIEINKTRPLFLAVSLAFIKLTINASRPSLLVSVCCSLSLKSTPITQIINNNEWLLSLLLLWLLTAINTSTTILLQYTLHYTSLWTLVLAVKRCLTILVVPMLFCMFYQ